jgi:hypothetical protein
VACTGVNALAVKWNHLQKGTLSLIRENCLLNLKNSRASANEVQIAAKRLQQASKIRSSLCYPVHIFIDCSPSEAFLRRQDSTALSIQNDKPLQDQFAKLVITSAII